MSSPCFALASVSIPIDFLTDPQDLYAVILSFAPWLISLSMMLLLFVKSFRHVPYFRAHCACFFFNWFVCDCLKFVFRQPRPIGTCLSSFGMPSSHSSTSVGFAMLILLQWRSPAAFPLFAHYVTSFEGNNSSPPPTANDGKAVSFLSLLESGNKKSLAWFRVFLMFNLMMIPWSRVHLMDHSIAQVCAGSCVGILISLMVFGWFSRRHSGAGAKAAAN